MARIILSWFPARPGGVLADIIEVLYAITEPFLAPIRKLIPPIAIGMGFLDLSPLILLLLLRVIREMLY
jgi:YggT family protein